MSDENGNGTQVADPPQQTTALAERPRIGVPIQSGPRGLQLNGFDEMWKFALAVQRSGLAPKGVQTPEAILVALQMGAEVGLTPMASLQNTAVINGRPSLFGDAQLAVVRGSGLFVEEEYDEWYSDARGERLPEETPFGPGMVSHTQVMRRGCKRPVVRTFSYKDAQDAFLLNKEGPWKNYPKRMMRWRSRGYALRDVFTDVLRGIPSTEEVSDRVDFEGEVVSPPAGKPVSAMGQKLKEHTQPPSTQSPAGPAEAQAAAEPATTTEVTPPSPAPSRPAAATTNATASGRAEPVTTVEAAPRVNPERPAPARTVDTTDSQVTESWEEFEASMWAIVEPQNADRDRFNAAILKSIRGAKKKSGHELAQFDRTLIARAIESKRGHFAYLMPEVPAKGE